MNDLSVSQVYLHDEEALWDYYNSCGLAPALKQLDRGPLDYRKTTYNLGDMFVCSTSSGSGWGFEKQQSTDVYFVTFTHKGQSTWEMNKQGNIQASQQLCVIDSSRLVQGRFSRGTNTDTIMIDAGFLNRELEAAQGFNCTERIEFQPLLPNKTKVWPMLNSIISCIKTIMIPEQNWQSPIAISYMKQALASTLIEAIPHNYKNHRQLKPNIMLPRHVARALDYMHAHASEDILISDIAIYAGTSVRNLQLGFRLYKNMTPMQYLRELRLTEAHKELLSEDIELRWQHIAIRWGFANLELFSRYYKKTYGETPFQVQYRTKGNRTTSSR